MENIKEFFEQAAIDIVGSAADPNTHLYKLEDGTIVHRVYVNTKKGGEEKNILFISDTHLTTWNLKDFEEKNPVILETIDKRRSSFRREDALLNTEKFMSWSTMFDKTVVGGDLIDYLTWGGIEYIQRFFYDKNPEAILLIGSHDTTRIVGYKSEIEDPTTLESREDIIRGALKTDIHYHSEIFADRALLIALDNGQHKYYDFQVEKLKADIEKAKKEDLDIFIFQHEHMATNNPKEKRINVLYENLNRDFNIHEHVLDFCDSPYKIGGPGTEGTTLELYNLIRENADIIKGVFCGHWHNEAYTEILGSYINENGEKIEKIIPQYIVTAAAYEKGHMMVITVK